MRKVYFGQLTLKINGENISPMDKFNQFLKFDADREWVEKSKANYRRNKKRRQRSGHA